MGNAAPQVVSFTDRKSIIKGHCLKRKPYDSLEYLHSIGLPQVKDKLPGKAGQKGYCATGPLEGRGPAGPACFLDKNILPVLQQFLFGSPLIHAFVVCPTWFVLFLRGLDDLCADIDEGFRRQYPEIKLEYARTDWSPVHTADLGVRVDRILIAQVTSAVSSSCVELAYTHDYCAESCPSRTIKPAPAKHQGSNYECMFKFDVHPSWRGRTFWMHKDICRFHGDETRVAATQNITPVCVNDRIEIAVNLFNAKGMVDIKSIRWSPLGASGIAARECPIEQELCDWYDLDSFQSQSVEKLQIPDFFTPQLMHDQTEYAGIDVAVSRTRFVASATGVVQNADRILGSRFEVLPRHSPIILPLKRVGLQHDRFTKIQLRQGDIVNLYISQGGKMT